ncbi:MAG: chemotaxis protein CheD [Hyphomicrobiales bacterium]|nr:MAG: chemotaxis protein CheD [Hyphomicrobiales bacterium]
MLQGRGATPAFDRGVVTTIHQGDCMVGGEEDLTFSTILGSCVSACIRDVAVNVGGMNHFLLAEPSGSARDRYGASARYGAFAMEQLINKVLSRGTGRKTNLEIKIFGGGLINSALTDIGAKNIEFVHEFLREEGYELAGEDVGGSFARRVMFKPYSGRAFVKRLDSVAASNVAREELSIVGSRRAPRPAPSAAPDIELF